MTRLVAGAALALATALAASCHPPASVVDDLDVSWQLKPEAPAVGQTALADVTIRLPDGSPVAGARLDLEGHMAHPGMAPLVIPLSDAGAGHYRANITLTMSGDWVMFVNGRLEDGRQLRRRVASVTAGLVE